MKQEDKVLLLKDLCARLIYGVKVNVKGGADSSNYDTTYTSDLIYLVGLREIKPYLRPMSSMTEEEIIYARDTFFEGSDNYTIDLDGDIYTESQPFESVYTLPISRVVQYIDWLNAKHFDHRGLIKRGLALEAPDGMYN